MHFQTRFPVNSLAVLSLSECQSFELDIVKCMSPLNLFSALFSNSVWDHPLQKSCHNFHFSHSAFLSLIHLLCLNCPSVSFGLYNSLLYHRFICLWIALNQVLDTHYSPLIHKSSYFILEGNQVWFTLGKSVLTLPDELSCTQKWLLRECVP